MSDKFKIGDLVWAKMKGFSPWPGRVSIPPPELKAPKKSANIKCIYFFGTNNFAWIEDGSIKPYHKFKEMHMQSTVKDAVSQIEEYILHPEKFPDIDAITKNTEVDFDRLKEVIESESNGGEEVEEVEGEVRKKISGTPKIRLGGSKIKAAKRRSSTVGFKTTPRKRSKKISLNHSLSDYDTKKPSMLNHSFSKNSSLLHRPSNTASPEAPPLDLQNISETLLEKKIQASTMKFGFLGLGIMGSGIVKNLLNSGHQVIVWNRTDSKCADFENAGAKVAVTPSDVVEEADITFSCVSDPQVAKEMVFGNCGVLHCPSLEQKAYVEMTSIDSDTSQDIVDAINGKGGRYLEAQIQGSKTEAEEGTLIILAAGDRSLFDDCQTCFKAMSKQSFYLGDVGNASKMNSVLQVVAGVSLAALAEGLALADRAGLNRNDLLDLLALTPMASTHLLNKGRAMVESTYSTHQPLSHMQKDLKLALALGDTMEQSLPLTATTNEIFKHAKRLGYANHDVSAVYVRARF